MSNLIDEIRAAREELRRQEAETSEAGHTLSMCKERQRKARKELDKLLDELETGVSRYPLPGFDRLDLPGGNGIPVPADSPAFGCGPASTFAEAKLRGFDSSNSAPVAATPASPAVGCGPTVSITAPADGPGRKRKSKAAK